MKKTIFLLLFFSIKQLTWASDTKFLYSTSLSPKFDMTYYAQQSDKYFNTLDSYADDQSAPKYSQDVIRWEWYPWLKLTGLGRDFMDYDWLLTLYPTKVINRVCKGFKTQPFGRCHVTFMYWGNDNPVHIYEEFTFNDLGEITFIEAWTDSKELSPMGSTDDYWAQSEQIKRLSTKVPGLGASGGNINLEKIKKLSKVDSDLNDLLRRLDAPLYYWFKELIRFISE